jgi:hypothetical protein
MKNAIIDNYFNFTFFVFEVETNFFSISARNGDSGL